MRTLIALLLIAGLGVFISPQAQAQTNVSGNFTLTANIYVHTAIPSGDALFCEVSLGEAGDSNGTNEEDIIVQATLKSGSTWTCAPQIFYYWHLSTPNTDIVTITWSIGIGPTSTTSKQQLVRSGVHVLPTVTGVPASGTSWGMNDDAAL
jgi:hypothetical protein